MPTVPPVRTTWTGERCDWTSTRWVEQPGRDRLREHLRVGVDEDVRGSCVDPREALLQHLAVDLVGVEAAQLFREALPQLPDGQRDAVLGLVGLAAGLAVLPSGRSSTMSPDDALQAHLRDRRRVLDALDLDGAPAATGRARRP